MERGDIIVYDDSCVTIETSKRRSKKRLFKLFKRLLLLFLLICMVALLIKFFPIIKGLFEKNSGSDNLINEPNNEVNNPSNEGNGNSTTVEIPEGNIKIETLGKFEYISINESGCEFDFSSEFSPTTLNEIYEKYGNEAPVVLITHSSIKECYSDGVSYSTNDYFYSDKKCVGDIGLLVCEELNSLGINAIHLNELYASGGILNSKAEYEKSLSEALVKYPSISYVFNISRGVKIEDDLTMKKGTISVDGAEHAQLSFTSGTSWDTASQNQTRNVLFAFDFANFANQKQDCFVCENKISRFALSQNVTPTSLNIDIGTYANSYEEASRSGKLLAMLFYEYIMENQRLAKG